VRPGTRGVGEGDGDGGEGDAEPAVAAVVGVYVLEPFVKGVGIDVSDPAACC